jgi:16S rRNA (guanine1207-N2)-methyltransferase
MKQDAYFKKVIDFQCGGKTLQFRVSQDLFSSHRVDVGTEFLLKTLVDVLPGDFLKVLDLGCGYGPIGLTLKKLDETRRVHLVDRDALAVAYARQNAALNQIADVEIYGSLGYDDVTATDFDLIVSNIPGKAGESVIAYLLRDACHFLRPGGRVAIVVVSALEAMVRDILKDPGIAIVLQEARSGHTVSHYRFLEGACGGPRPDKSAVERGIYHREDISVTFHDRTFPMQTARGLPEFDMLDYRSELLLEGLLSLRRPATGRAVVFNPGQGYAPVVLWKQFNPGAIVLVDRDLLSLRYAGQNLALNACPDARIQLRHQTGLLTGDDGVADLIVGTLREDEGPEGCALTIRQAAGQLAPDGTILVVAGSTAVTRLVDIIRTEKLLRIEKRKRNKGNSLLVLRPK